ncbi:uncharacterized protein BDR25DRAFT_357178 [Lindgomyces ingoldianus]|uniref:Uncharacterized protein n=1 Tax=Lindgomyces ingoldianus TaxID=673940 RepID=A0ACB6QRT7_9PLEO|nr:uncharacterized protein BDR25DRAFT_357178 [Lindgomyces ingoldianus]KAF2468815.1 hypothetical protein BDR25DRAFT_357178 [Lindgomyces ingoldianus]
MVALPRIAIPYTRSNPISNITASVHLLSWINIDHKAERPLLTFLALATPSFSTPKPIQEEVSAHFIHVGDVWENAAIHYLSLAPSQSFGFPCQLEGTLIRLLVSYPSSTGLPTLSEANFMHLISLLRSNFDYFCAYVKTIACFQRSQSDYVLLQTQNIQGFFVSYIQQNFLIASLPFNCRELSPIRADILVGVGRAQNEINVKQHMSLSNPPASIRADSSAILEPRGIGREQETNSLSLHWAAAHRSEQRARVARLQRSETRMQSPQLTLATAVGDIVLPHIFSRAKSDTLVCGGGKLSAEEPTEEASHRTGQLSCAKFAGFLAMPSNHFCLTNLIEIQVTAHIALYNQPQRVLFPLAGPSGDASHGSAHSQSRGLATSLLELELELQELQELVEPVEQEE